MFYGSFIPGRDAILLTYKPDKGPVEIMRIVDGLEYERLGRPINFDLWQHGTPVIAWGESATWLWDSGITYAP